MNSRCGSIVYGPGPSNPPVNYAKMLSELQQEIEKKIAEQEGPLNDYLAVIEEIYGAYDDP